VLVVDSDEEKVVISIGDREMMSEKKGLLGGQHEEEEGYNTWK